MTEFINIGIYAARKSFLHIRVADIGFPSNDRTACFPFWSHPSVGHTSSVFFCETQKLLFYCYVGFVGKNFRLQKHYVRPNVVLSIILFHSGVKSSLWFNKLNVNVQIVCTIMCCVLRFYSAVHGGLCIWYNIT